MYIIKKKIRGFTFVETIVTIAIVSVVMLGTTMFFSRMWTMHHFVIKSGIASFVASRAVEDMINTMRKAQQADNGSFPIAFADDHEFIFYADYDDDNTVERIRYFLDGNILKMGIIEPDNSTPSKYVISTEVVKDIAKNITNTDTSGEAIFEYYDIDGEIYSYSDIEGKALATIAVPAEIRMVKVILYINPEPYFRSPNDVRIQSFVVVRNLTEFDEIPT